MSSGVADICRAALLWTPVRYQAAARLDRASRRLII
jgi:hypothetical protein